MRIGRLAGWRRALLLLALLPFSLTQSGYDSETQPIQQPFTPRGYQPPPQPARYPVPAPAPRFQPHNAVGYQPPPQPALYENHQQYEQPSRPVYRPVTPQRPAQPQYHPEPQRPAPAYQPEPSRPSYESVPIQVPQHRPAPQPQLPSQYEAISQQPHRPASQPPPVPHRPSPAPRTEPSRPAYEPEPERPSQYEAAPSPSRPPQRPVSTYPPKPSRPAYEPEPERPSPYEAQSVPTTSRPIQRPAPTYPPESFTPAPYVEEVPNPYDFTPNQRPQQRPEQTRQPPSIEPTGTFHPAPGTQPGEGEGLNVMIHVFINEKLPAGVTTEAPGPIAPPQSLPPHIASMHFPHSSMPLTFTRDFDRTKNRFLMDDEEDQQQEGPANIVEIKAVVDSSDAAMDMRIGKAMAKELDRAVPAILGKIRDKTSRLDEGLRNQLEQELISEISKNLGGHLEQSTDVSEKEISDLIEEGLKELESNESTPSPPQTPPTRPAPTTRPAAPPAPSQTTTQPTQPTRPATTSQTMRPSSPPSTSNPPSTSVTTHAQHPAHPPSTAASPAPSSRAPAPPATSTATSQQSQPPATSRPTQQTQPPATAAPAVTQPTAPPATVQWWTPTPAAPSTEATAPPAQHQEAGATTEPTPPLATMRTFPTETLPLPVTQPTLKVPESMEETNENIDETPFNHKGDDFPTEQPARPMHESTTTSTKPTTPSKATTVPEFRPTLPAATEAPGSQSTTPPPTPVTPSTGTASRPAESSTVPATEGTNATEQPATQATPAEDTIASTTGQSKSEATTEPAKPEQPTESTSESSVTTPSTPETTVSESFGTSEAPVTPPSGTKPLIPKTASEEEADEVSLDDLISAIEDGLNEEEKKKLLESSKEKSAEETTTASPETTTPTSPAEETTGSSTTKSELESELEHELSKELTETSDLADELSKALSKELKSEETPEVKSGELADDLSKTLSKELKSEEKPEIKSSELADELSKTLSKELLKSEESELEKALSAELEKGIEEGKSIETLIHEGEEAFEKLEKEKVTDKQTEETTTPSKEHEEMPFEGKDTFAMESMMNATDTSKEEEKTPTSECSVPRNSSDTTKADVLFLLDSSNTFNQEKFNGALELIANTTGHFMNIGPDGVQVSLIQFASEPQLEFSLRRHNCLPMLIEDIKGTEHLKGASMLGHAIDKATRLAFTRERGDRVDAENILIIVTDGATEDKVQQPVTVAKENGVAVLVISTIEADPEVVLEMAGTADNVFKMDGKITEPLSTRLAQRIRDTASGYHIPEQRFPTFHENKDGSAEEKKKEQEGAEKPKDDGSTTELPSTLMSGEVTQEMLPPPKNLKLVCTRKSLGINIELSGAFHGWLYIEGQREKENCSMKVEKEEGKAFRHVHFEAGIEECDIAHIQSESPAGINSSAVVSIVKHPKAVSIDDKAYLLECFVASAVETTLDAHLEVVGGIKKTIAEAFSLDVVPPKCHYTIRKGSPEGPEVEKADLGEVVFHRWDCDGGDEAYDVFGMHIHDCYASSDVEQQFPILDSNGCSSNTNLLSAPVYAEGALSVYAESRAFAVENDQQDLKFQCKVSLCTRDGDGCEGITPPHCSGNATDLLVSRRLRHNQAVDSALTSAVATSVGLTTAAVSRFSPILIVCAIILAIAIGLISAVRLKSCRARSTSRPIVTSPSMEEIYVTVPGRAPIRTTAPNPAMTEFMKNFDRSRYV